MLALYEVEELLEDELEDPEVPELEEDAVLDELPNRLLSTELTADVMAFLST